MSIPLKELIERHAGGVRGQLGGALRVRSITSLTCAIAKLESGMCFQQCVFSAV